MAGCCSLCWKCCKCLSLLIVALCIIVIISLKYCYNSIPEWLEKSDCSEMNQATCICPHFEIDDYDSSFVAFDVCLSNNWTVPDNLESCFKHSYSFSRGDISIGSGKVENILIYFSDFNISDYSINNECDESSLCETNDIFAHIIVYDYPKSFDHQKRYINHHSIKLISHEFKNSSIPTQIEPILRFKSQINVSFVTEYGCFDGNYWGNNILFRHMTTGQHKNEPYSPIVIVNDNIRKQTITQTTTPVRLSVAFNAQSIFKFQMQSLLRMNNQEIDDAQIHAPKMFISNRIFWGLAMGGSVGILNSVNSFDEIQNWLTEIITMFGSMVITTIFGMISLKADFNYWTNSKLTMKNICCAAVLIYSIVPTIYNQQPAYTHGFTQMDDYYTNAEGQNDESSNTTDDYYTNFSSQFGEYLARGNSEELVGVVISFFTIFCMVFITAFVYVIFPILKAIKSFKLKKEEGVRNDVVAVCEGLLVIMGCVVIGCKDELMYYFSRYVGMAIFIPQILINYCLDNSDAAPKLPLKVWFISILNETITSLMFYYMSQHIKITTFDIVYWIRDVLILIILYLQWKFRMNKVIGSKNNCQNTVENNFFFNPFYCAFCSVIAMLVEFVFCERVQLTYHSVIIFLWFFWYVIR